MRTLMLASLVVALGLTSGCFISKTEKEKEIRSNQPMTQADCERTGGKWKSSSNRCD
jgi:hypothetical protein